MMGWSSHGRLCVLFVNHGTLVGGALASFGPLHGHPVPGFKNDKRRGESNTSAGYKKTQGYPVGQNIGTRITARRHPFYTPFIWPTGSRTLQQIRNTVFEATRGLLRACVANYVLHSSSAKT